LKTRALTAQVYVDEVDVDEEGIAEMVMCGQESYKK
jgi:tetratricopeptide repeat protein 8